MQNTTAMVDSVWKGVSIGKPIVECLTSGCVLGYARPELCEYGYINWVRRLYRYIFKR